MGTNRVSDPFDDLPKTVATDIAFCLKYINPEVFDAILMEALKNYNAPRNSWVWFPIYAYSRQRGKTILEYREEFEKELDSASIPEHQTISQLVEKVFKEGSWEETSFNTLFMSLLIKQLDGYGINAEEKIRKYRLDLKNFYLEIKKHLFVMIAALDSITAKNRIEEGENKLKEVNQHLEDKKQELQELEKSIEAKKQDEHSVEISIQQKRITIHAELAQIETEKQQTMADLEEARHILRNVSNMNEETREAVLHVMEVAALDYLAELNKKEKEQAEKLSVCAMSAKAREELVRKKAQLELHMQRSKEERIAEATGICKKSAAEKNQRKTAATNMLEKALAERIASFQRVSSLYSKGRHEVIPDPSSWQKGLESIDSAVPNDEKIVTNKPVPRLSKAEQAELKAKREKIEKSHGHLFAFLKPPAQQVKPKSAKPDTKQTEPSCNKVVTPRKVELTEVMCPDGVKRTFPLSPPPPPNKKPQLAMLFAPRAECSVNMDSLRLQEEDKRREITVGVI